ncbi:MAG: RNA polymerase sigma factor [Clostridia bacterium]|nr:RNA polymerase sigma factor [Clostridia bacterium]
MDNGASSYRRFLDGDDSAFTEIVRDYKDGLIFFLGSFVGDIQTAEELAEDTFVRIGIKKPLFGARSSFKTWLYAVGRNVAVDYLRKIKRQNTVSLETYGQVYDDGSLENSFFREERKIVIHRAMSNLKEEYRQVLWLFYFEDLSQKEISKIMKKSVHNIETLTYRARQSLKSELIKEGFTYEDL